MWKTQKEAWWLVKVWYCHQAHTPPLTLADLSNIGRDYHNLYMRQEPPGEPIHGMVSLDIPDDIPNNNEIVNTVKTLHNGCTPGASGMKVKDLKWWFGKCETTLAPWLLVIDMVQYAFLTGVVPT